MSWIFATAPLNCILLCLLLLAAAAVYLNLENFIASSTVATAAAAIAIGTWVHIKYWHFKHRSIAQKLLLIILSFHFHSRWIRLKQLTLDGILKSESVCSATCSAHRATHSEKMENCFFVSACIHIV